MACVCLSAVRVLLAMRVCVSAVRMFPAVHVCGARCARAGVLVCVVFLFLFKQLAC